MATRTTGARDATYNLISILYHALQGAETYQQYVRDAGQGSGDQELAQFFRDVQQEEQRRAECLEVYLAWIIHEAWRREAPGGFAGRGRHRRRSPYGDPW